MLLGWGLAMVLILFPDLLSTRKTNIPNPDQFAIQVLRVGVTEYDSVVRENDELIRELDRLEFELEYEKRRFEDFQDFVKKAGSSGSRTVTQYLQVTKNRKWDPVNKVWITE